LKLADHPFLIEYIENFEYKQKYFCIITKLAVGGDLKNFIYQKNEILGFSEKEALIYLA
jgi:serine/threonine protein kinase